MRADVGTPKVLHDGPEAAGATERREFERWIAAGRSKKRRPEWRAYKHADVGAALARLFHDKCAYCESKYDRTQPVDIEHWRPKAEVHEGTTVIAGYEWLGAEWTNLLPSCIDCNRERKQLVFNLEAGTIKDRSEKAGKANRFPLHDPKFRARSHRDDLSRERPLLLDPTVDDPTEYFEYRRDGVLVVRAGAPDARRGIETIRTCALNRRGLVDERRGRLLLLLARFELIRNLMRLEAGLAEEARRSDRVAGLRLLATDLVETELAGLVESCHPRQPFSAMMRQFVTEFLVELAGRGAPSQAALQAHGRE